MNKSDPDLKTQSFTMNVNIVTLESVKPLFSLEDVPRKWFNFLSNNLNIWKFRGGGSGLEVGGGVDA